MKKIVLIYIKNFFIPIFLLFLVTIFQSTNARAQNLPDPSYQHISFNAVNNQEIVHDFKVDGVLNKRSFSPVYIVPKSVFLGDSSGDMLAYETRIKDIYFVVDLSDFRSPGLFKKTDNNKMLRIIEAFPSTNWVESNFPQITNDQDRKYFITLMKSAIGASIQNMTPDTLPNKELVVDKIKITVEYDQDSDGFKNLKPDQLARANLGLPPENMPCYLFYAPETSVSFSHSVIKRANIDKDGNLDFGTIKTHKGWYKAICQFHIMTPNATGAGEKAFFDWDQDWYEAGFWSGVSAWASTVAGTITNVAGTIASWFDGYKGDPEATSWLRDNYWSSYAVHLSDIDSLTSIELKDMEMKNETALNNRLGPLGNRESGGQCVSKESGIIAMVQEGLCAITVVLKGWADSFFKWAQGLMEASIGITGTKNIDLDDEITLPSKPSSSATSSAGTPASTNGNSTNATSIGNIVYSTSFTQTASDSKAAAINMCKKAKDTDKVDLSKQPCLVKDLTYTHASDNSFYDAQAGVQIYNGDEATFISENQTGVANNKYNKCGTDVSNLILIYTDCTYNRFTGLVWGLP